MCEIKDFWARTGTMKIILLVLFSGFSPSQLQDIHLQSRPVVRSSLGEKAVLPCRIEGGRTASTLSVAWTRDDGRPVYTHLAGKGEAGDGFQERASLDQSKLDAGDVSLLLSNASIPDEGGYICQVEMASVSVELRLGRLGSRPEL
ncbi:hypothetical protein AGOR_G00132300 [Albula goreensis]|uniref:Ig-like domain-containing protein n=1 Tax=Albula goreensis TaxID=1534307 RepID=A0A8T3DCR3_9TELE|nr:hypothetical protein AGOR_G00132300 [Albula goreensis]